MDNKIAATYVMMCCSSPQTIPGLIKAWRQKVERPPISECRMRRAVTALDKRKGKHSLLNGLAVSVAMGDIVSKFYVEKV